jgi:hypothetical protein
MARLKRKAAKRGSGAGALGVVGANIRKSVFGRAQDAVFPPLAPPVLPRVAPPVLPPVLPPVVPDTPFPF